MLLGHLKQCLLSEKQDQRKISNSDSSFWASSLINSLKNVLKSEATYCHSKNGYTENCGYACVFLPKFTRFGRLIQTSFLRSRKVYCRGFVLLWGKIIYYYGGATIRDRRKKERKGSFFLFRQMNIFSSAEAYIRKDNCCACFYVAFCA